MPSDILKSKKPSASWDSEERKYKLKPGARFDSAFLPVVQNLVAAGLTEADIGMVFGYQGANAKEWLGNLKRSNGDLRKACDVGVQVCNAMHVAQMICEAWGYDYTETKRTYKYVYDPSNPTESTKILVAEEETDKHKPGNAALLQFIAENRLPEYFKRRFEVTKKNVNIDIAGEVSADQVDRLFGELCNKKAIEAEVLEATFAEEEDE